MAILFKSSRCPVISNSPNATQIQSNRLPSPIIPIKLFLVLLSFFNLDRQLVSNTQSLSNLPTSLNLVSYMQTMPLIQLKGLSNVTQPLTQRSNCPRLKSPNPSILPNLCLNQQFALNSSHRITQSHPIFAQFNNSPDSNGQTVQRYSIYARIVNFSSTNRQTPNILKSSPKFLTIPTNC